MSVLRNHSRTPQTHKPDPPVDNPHPALVHLLGLGRILVAGMGERGMRRQIERLLLQFLLLRVLPVHL